MPALRFFFHTETTLQAAPAPPAGSLTLSELVPDTAIWDAVPVGSLRITEFS